VIVSDILSLFCNGSDALAMAGRDKDATWRTLSTHCRALGWSKSRAVYELQNGLPHRTIPPGHTIDWHNPDIAHTLDVETGDLTLILGAFGGPGLGFDTLTVSIEVLAPTDAEVPSPPVDASVWAFDTVRDLRAAGKIPAKAMESKAALARFLAAESEKAAQAGRLRHALKASYIENWLGPWGIWPLSASE
jgi:hypothetical protein